MSRPKVLFGANSIAAVRHFLLEPLLTVRQRGFDPIVTAPGPEDAAVYDAGGNHVPYHRIEMEREISPLQDLLALWYLWQMMVALRPEITNLSTPKMGFLGGIAAWIAGVPHRIYVIRGLRYETTSGWKRAALIACERIACICATQVICISRSVREVAVRDRLVAPERATLLGEQISEGATIPPMDEEGVADDLRKALGIPEDAQVLGFVGRLTKDKGVGELVECFRLLREKNPKVRLLVLGEFEAGDPVDAASEQFIRSCPEVHWPGYVTDPERYFPLMDVFVLPTYREGLPKVIIQAAAAGRPVVSTYVTGVVDAVQDGLTGILVPPCDARALARATATLLEDRDLAARMGKRARFLMEQQYDNTLYMAKLGDMLESLVHTDAHPSGPWQPKGGGASGLVEMNRN